MRHDPVNDAVSVDLLDDGLCHKEMGTYTKCRPGSPQANSGSKKHLMPRLSEVEVVAAACRNSCRRLGIWAIWLV